MAAIDVKKRKSAQLHSDGGALLDILLEMPSIENAAKDASESAADMRKVAERRLVMYHEYRDKFRKMKDELVGVQTVAIEQAEKIGEYEALMEEMNEDYERTIHEITPLLFEKSWVKNRGKLLCHFVFTIYRIVNSANV